MVYIIINTICLFNFIFYKLQLQLVEFFMSNIGVCYSKEQPLKLIVFTARELNYQQTK